MDDLIFERLPVPEFARWRGESGEKPYPHWQKVTTETAGVRSLTLILRPYRPYLPTDEGVSLSAFYVASNALHEMCGAQLLNLPLKPLIAGYGIGAYGRCGVTAVPGVGSRYAVAALGSEEEPDSRWEWREDRPFSEECEGCGRCVAACPAGALRGNGRVDMDRCLRAQAQYQTPRMADEDKARIGSILWGCEVCQEVCPRNRDVEPTPMPPELARALDLKRLLEGDVEPLAPWIGSNYARKARMQARACMVAANLGRGDLLEEIVALRESPVEAVRDCAAWAMRRLGGANI